jgi:hypothetical protein
MIDSEESIETGENANVACRKTEIGNNSPITQCGKPAPAVLSGCSLVCWPEKAFAFRGQPTVGAIP